MFVRNDSRVVFGNITNNIKDNKVHSNEEKTASVFSKTYDKSQIKTTFQQAIITYKNIKERLEDLEITKEEISDSVIKSLARVNLDCISEQALSNPDENLKGAIIEFADQFLTLNQQYKEIKYRDDVFYKIFGEFDKKLSALFLKLDAIGSQEMNEGVDENTSVSFKETHHKYLCDILSKGDVEKEDINTIISFIQTLARNVYLMKRWTINTLHGNQTGFYKFWN